MATFTKVPLLYIAFIISISQSNVVNAFTPGKATLSTFANSACAFQNKKWRLFSSTAEEQITNDKVVELVGVIPSWEELQNKLPENEVEPKVTLYRDTNGWCPFCERVWVALRVKGIPFKESLVPLQNKPQWYKDLVPTTLVPAVLFHGDEDQTERKVVWESDAILKSLDELFPDTPQLMLDTEEFKQALELTEKVGSAGFKFVYGNSTLGEEELIERKNEFNKVLDEVNDALDTKNGGGPFYLGAEFTGIDAILIPMMERWRYQLPITKELDILEGRPNLQKWFDALDSYGPYYNCVAGDTYSWTATTSVFLRYFGGGGADDSSIAKSIQLADDSAEELITDFANYEQENEQFALEAATKLISNHEAIVIDCTNSDPKSQQHLARATDKESTADHVLRYVASLLTSSPASAIQEAKSAPLIELDNPEAGSLVARTVAKRLCVPRDMGAPSAAILRSVLCTIANRLDK